MAMLRRDKLLNEAISALDLRLADAKRMLPKATIEVQTAAAWTLLSPLELEFIQAEIGNCTANRMYYLSNYHAIMPENGVVLALAGASYGLWDHQWQVEEALAAEIELNGLAKIIVLKPRQAGITEYASGVMCWRTFFLPNAYTVSVAQAPDVAAHIQRKINITYERLPWWMRPERQYVSKGEYLEFNRKDLGQRSTDPGLGSVFVTTHAQRTTGVAIGRTVRSAHFSEVSRWPDGEVYTGDIEPSMNALDTLAIAESTALGEDGFYFNLWNEAYEAGGDSDWKPVFLPTYKAKKFSTPLKPSQRPFVLTELEQAVRDRVLAEERYHVTDEFFNWRRRRIKASIKRTGYPYAHYESYPITPEEAFQSSGDAAFPRHKLDEQGQKSVCRPKWFGEIVFQGMNAAPKLILEEVTPETELQKREFSNRLFLWERPEPAAIYYIGADCGNGNGPDFSVAQIMRAGQGASPDVQVGEWVGFEQAEAYGRTLYALGMYFNRAEIAVEYAQEGMTTANYLMNELEYPNLYRPRNRDRMGKQLASYMHWQTTGKTKPLIMGKMSETLLEDGIIIRSIYLLNELRKAGKEGSAFAGVGAHDDAAMAACITLFCLRETLPELRTHAHLMEAGNTTPTASARAGAGAMVFGVYDQFRRLVGQTRNLAIAESFVRQNTGYALKPIVVSKANTAYSVVHHGGGIETEMMQQGMDSWEITPSTVSAYRENTGRMEQIEGFMQAGQGPWRTPPGKRTKTPQDTGFMNRMRLSAAPPGGVHGGGKTAQEVAWLNSAMSGQGEVGMGVN